ncbi:hypothetical protein V2T80_11580, partial [Streptococcus agalactiae]
PQKVQKRPYEKKGLAPFEKPAYSSPLAAKHSAETQVAVVELSGGEAGVGRVCGRLGGWRLAVNRVVVGSELTDKNSSTSC